MLDTLLLLLLFQFIGEAIAALGNLPIPGPVIGMTLLFIALLVRGRLSSKIKAANGQFLQFLPLMFIPACAAIYIHLERLQQEWLPLLAATVVSSLLGMFVTVKILQFFLKKRR